MRFFLCFSHQPYRSKTSQRVLPWCHNILTVLTQNVIKTMADSTKYGRVRHYSYKPSSYTPVFNDLDRYLPQPRDGEIFSPLKRRYPKPLVSPSIHNSWNKNLSTDASKTSSTATNSTPVEQVNFSYEQRTLSVSSGEVLYSSSGQKRPAKRRHLSTATPGFPDDIPVETKKAKRNYSTPANNASRLLRFHPFDAEPPVFTLDTLTKEIQEECQKSVQTRETLEKKLKLKAFLEHTLSPVYPGCSLHLCGSSSNGFGSDSSDADFCFILNHLKQSNNRKEALPVLRQMQRLLNKDPTYSFLSNCSVIPASVPILKFVDTISDCECDININNTVGVRNTHLLRAYCGVDYRVKPLVVLVKKWAKKHDINDASLGTLSSYALTLMVIHYLQGVCKPAVVPVLQRQYPNLEVPAINIPPDRRDKNKLFKYHGDVSGLLREDPCQLMNGYQSENRQSLGELFVGFFKYYAEEFRLILSKRGDPLLSFAVLNRHCLRDMTKFKVLYYVNTQVWNKDYISIAMGEAYPRYRGRWQRKPICIEEPFDGNNVAKSVCSIDQFNRIHMKFRLAWHTLKISPSLESIKVT